MRVRAVGPAWCHQPASQPASTTQNPDELQEAAAAAPADWHTVQMFVFVRVCTGVYSRALTRYHAGWC